MTTTRGRSAAGLVFATMRLVAVDTLQGLRRRLFGRETTVRLRDGPQPHLATVRGLPRVEGERLLVTLAQPEEQTPVLVRVLVLLHLIRPTWLVAMLLLSPLFALLSVLGGVIASSRMNDPRAAQALSGLFVVPLIGGSMAVLFGKLFVNVQWVVYGALVTLLVDLWVLWLAVKLFRRETILTRWR